jgi:hypothetical protein
LISDLFFFPVSRFSLAPAEGLVAILDFFFTSAPLTHALISLPGT